MGQLPAGQWEFFEVLKRASANLCLSHSIVLVFAPKPPPMRCSLSYALRYVVGAAPTLCNPPRASPALANEWSLHVWVVSRHLPYQRAQVGEIEAGVEGVAGVEDLGQELALCLL